jgi:hypothetical protein
MKKLLSTLALTLLLTPQGVEAVPIDSTYVWEDEKVIDFSEFASITNPSHYTPTRQIGTPNGDDIMVSTSYGRVYINNSRTPLGDAGNGTWDYRREGYALLDGGRTVYMTFTFTEPLSVVGGYINYDGTYRRPDISILDANGIERSRYTLDSHHFPFNSYNLGKFYGISREENDIYGFRIIAGPAVLDDLTYSYASDPELVPEPVPEPATIFLFGTGLVALATFRRRTRK